MNKIITTLAMLLIGFASMSQTYLISEIDGNVGSGATSTCAGILYDSGGASGNYSANEDFTATICSDNGSTVTLTFTQFDTENGGDFLTIIDGPITDAPVLISAASGNTLNGQIITSSSNCLTLVWSSNGSTERAGFAATISCGMLCQGYFINYVSSTPALTYPDSTYIDICQGTEVTINVNGQYDNAGDPESYPQSNATVDFNWMVINGDRDTIRSNGMGMTSFSYTFNEPGGYFVEVYGIDENGCRNINYSEYRIRVSGKPGFAGTFIDPNPICPGQEVDLNGITQNHVWRAPIPEILAGTTFLPDGSGVAYRTYLNFNIFNPNATITSMEQIEEILINIEHSYLGDLSIIIECPNGQRCLLKAYNSTTPFGLYMTETVPPADIQTSGSINGGSIHLGWAPDPSSTNPCYLEPGEGIDYWFTPTSTRPFGPDGPTQSQTYTDPCGNTETWQQLESGYYGPYQSMRSLVGCPLNGRWTIEIRDNIGSDNGYIFYWGIRFAQDLYPTDLWVIENTIASSTWSGENITNATGPVGNATPETAGTSAYVFNVIDNFGCSYDTTVYVHVRDERDPLCCLIPQPDAGIDEAVCSNIYTLHATVAAGNTGEWTVTGGDGTPHIQDPTSNITQVNIGNIYGTYEFTWTEYYRGRESCSNSASVSITFNQTFDPTLAPIADLCVNANPVQIQAVNLGILSIVPNRGLTNNTFNPYEAGPGTYTITNTINAPCLVNQNDNTRTFTVYDELAVSNIIETCIGGGTPHLEISFTVNNASDNSTAPYTVNGIAQSSPNFIDINPPAGYSYRVRDINGCSNIIVNGYRFCACPLSAGTMSTLQPQILCEGECINTTFTHNGDQIHDFGGGSDIGIFQFMVHLGDNIPLYRSADLSTICPNNIPGFSFGTVYYISAIMGYDDGRGNANISGAVECKSISAGTPVVWQQNPIAQAGSDKEVCGLTVTLEGNTPPVAGMIGYWTANTQFYATGGTDRDDPNAMVVVPAFGTYIFTWNMVNSQCTASDTVEITFKRTPIPYAGSDIVVCGPNAQLSATPSGQAGSVFAWSGNNTNYTDRDQASTGISLINPIFGTYEYTITETNGQCIGNDKVLVTFIEEPNPIIFSTVDTVCGESYNLSVQTRPYAVGRWTAYENGVPLLSANFSNETGFTTNVNIGAYEGLSRDIEFRWTETQSSHNQNCSGSVSTTVTFVKQPSARIPANSEIIQVCGNQVDLSASMEGTFEGTQSLWITKGDEIAGIWDPAGATSPNTSFTVTEPGIFGDRGYAQIEFLWTLTHTIGAHECVSTDQVTTIFYERPAPNAGNPTAQCGPNYDLGAVFSIPESSTYSPIGIWSVADNRIGANISQYDYPTNSNNSASVVVSEYGRWDFVFTETNALYQCLGRDTVTIEFVRIPSVSISGDNYICDSITVLTANDSDAQGGRWSVIPNDATDGIREPNNRITNVTSNIRNTVLTYTWSAYNASSEEFGLINCSNSASYDVTFWEEGKAIISTDTTNRFACGNEFCGLQADPPGSQYWGQWHASEPGITIANDTALTTCATASRINGNYTFTWVVNIIGQEEGFCQATSEPFKVFFAEKPDPFAGSDTLFCGNTGSLRAVPTTGTGRWTVSQEGITIENPNAYNSRVISGDNYDEYTFTWIEDSGNGCTGSDDVLIRFVELPSSGITVMPPRCSGEPATIIAVDSLMAHYEWQFNNGIRDSFRVNSQGGEYYNFVHWNILNPSDSIHNVRLITTDGWNCKSIPTRVEIREPHILGYQNTIVSDTCNLHKGEIRFNSDHDLSVAFKWIDRDNGIVTRDSSRVYNLEAGDYDVRAYYRSSNTQFHNYYRRTFGTEFCDDTVSITIPLIGMINADIDVDAGVAIDQLVVPAPVTFLNLTDYDNVRQRCEWHFGDGTTVNSCSPTIEHTYSEAGEYIPYLVVINRDLIECRDTAILDIRIIVGNQSSMEVPNVFSPNGDNINDYFQVSAESLESFHGRILNRWGNQVFEWSDWQNENAGWDGLINGGSEASPGVYYFVIKAKGLDGVVHDIEGFLHLMR